MQDATHVLRWQVTARYARRLVCRGLAVGGLAASLLVLPVSGGPLSTPLSPSVAEAAPEAAKRTCPPTLSNGDRGHMVEFLQDLLNTELEPLGYRPIATDGIFAGETVGHVKLVQHWHRLEMDGIVGPKTWKALKQC